MQEFRKNCGVTLIALVITVIVLLILAGVTIGTLTGDNGILQQAFNAKEKTKESSIEEKIKLAILGSYDSNGKLELNTLVDTINSSITDITISADEFPITIHANNLTFIIKEDGTISKIPIELKIGDYINYQSVLQSKQYDSNINETGHNVSQKFVTNMDTKWRILDINNGNIQIILEGIIYDTSGNGLVLKGKTGFLNAETVLNNLCYTIYSSQYGKAKSISYEEIYNLTKNIIQESEKKEYIRQSGIFWDKENNVFISATYTNQIIEENNYYTYTIPSDIELFDTIVNYNYWLSSRMIDAKDDGTDYRVNRIHGGDFSGRSLVYSDINNNFYEYDYELAVRPIVTLNDSILLEKYKEQDGVTIWNIKQ